MSDFYINMRCKTVAGGFSLVELSIVLVILGLLVGGVLSGRNLIRAAEVRNVTVEFQQLQTAFYSFQERYFALAGDMQDATRFWGERHEESSACYLLESVGQETCNGNGNGRIDSVVERFLAWQHLANAGLIAGQYTGRGARMSGAGWTGCLAGKNCPKSKVQGASWQPSWFNSQAASADYYPWERPEEVLYFGSYTMPGGHARNPHEPILEPQEAWSIDNKLDDGLPGKGFIRTYRKGSSSMARVANCADSPDAEVAVYDVGESGVKCALVFMRR